MNTSKKSGIESYRKTLKEFGISPKAVHWVSEKSQLSRYFELTHDLNLNGKTILDVGCGFGDFVKYLSKKYTNFDYTGVDTVPEFIDIAKKQNKSAKNHKIQFICDDYFDHPLKEKFDFIFVSGSLSANIQGAISYRKEFIKLMWEHANKVVAFNMQGNFPQPKNKKSNRVYYANSLDILKYCLSFTWRVIFRQHYNPMDFTIIMIK